MAINDKDFYASHGLDFDYKNMLDEYIKGIINQAKIEVLTELQLEIEEMVNPFGTRISGCSQDGWKHGVMNCDFVIQLKIDKLREGEL